MKLRLRKVLTIICALSMILNSVPAAALSEGLTEEQLLELKQHHVTGSNPIRLSEYIGDQLLPGEAEVPAETVAEPIPEALAEQPAGDAGQDVPQDPGDASASYYNEGTDTQDVTEQVQIPSDDVIVVQPEPDKNTWTVSGDLPTQRDYVVRIDSRAEMDAVLLLTAGPDTQASFSGVPFAAATEAETDPDTSSLQSTLKDITLNADTNYLVHISSPSGGSFRLQVMTLSAWYNRLDRIAKEKAEENQEEEEENENNEDNNDNEENEENKDNNENEENDNNNETIPAEGTDNNDNIPETPDENQNAPEVIPENDNNETEITDQPAATDENNPDGNENGNQDESLNENQNVETPQNPENPAENPEEAQPVEGDKPVEGESEEGDQGENKHTEVQEYDPINATTDDPTETGETGINEGTGENEESEQGEIGQADDNQENNPEENDQNDESATTGETGSNDNKEEENDQDDEDDTDDVLTDGTDSDTANQDETNPDGDAGDTEEEAPIFQMEGTILVRYNGEDETVAVPEGTTEIGKEAFLGNKFIKTVIIPDSVEFIQSYAFANCVNLEKVILSENSSLEVIGISAFRNDAKLDTSFAENVPSILSNAFDVEPDEDEAENEDENENEDEDKNENKDEAGEEAGNDEEDQKDDQEEEGQIEDQEEEQEEAQEEEIPEWQESPLVYQGEDYTLSVFFEESACIPYGTVLHAREIMPGTEEYLLYAGQTEEILNKDWTEIADFARYFDITFFYNDEPIEPQDTVEVQVTFAEKIAVTEDTDLQAIHFAEEGAEVISTETQSVEAAVNDANAVDTFNFSTDGFSVYCFVQTAKITESVITADGTAFSIEVTYDQNSEIPVNADLVATEILPEDERYEGLLQEALLAARKNKVEEAGEEFNEEEPVDTSLAQYARFFDIEIQVDGEKKEPQGNVSVNMSLADAPQEQQEDMTVVHFGEEKTEVLTAETAPNEEDATTLDVQFETDSFSVYGVMVMPTTPNSDCTNLDGRMFKISRNNNGTKYYATAEIDETRSVHQLIKTNEAGKAAIWQFTTDGTSSNKYYISTNVNGETRYLNYEPVSGDTERAHASLSNEPQAFTVDIYNGYYRIMGTVEGSSENQFLNEFRGEIGFAACKWGTDGPSLLTLDFSSETLMDTEQYMLVARYNGENYIVLNDGRLEKATQPEDSTTATEIGAMFTTPMTWTWDGNHLFHNSLAAGYTTDQRASDFYRRYIDPTSDTGLTQEHGQYEDGTVADPEHAEAEIFNKTYVTVESLESYPKYKTIINRVNALTETSFNISGESLFKIFSGDSYLGITEESDGTLRISGNKTESTAAEFWFGDPRTKYNTSDGYVTLQLVDTPIDGEQYYVLIKGSEWWDGYHVVNPDRSLSDAHVSSYNDYYVFASKDNLKLWTYTGNLDACQISSNTASGTVYLSAYYSNPIDTQSWDLQVDTNNNSQIIGYGGNYFYINNNQIACENNGNHNEVRLARLVTGSDMQYGGNGTEAERNHMVNHIDIAIEGMTNLTVPLAYGTYKYIDPDTQEMREFTVSKSTDLDLTQYVPITEDDIKEGSISAYVLDANGVPQYKDNLFTITGYSANETTEFSKDQVRIEGNFKVADLDYRSDEDSTETRRLRLEKKVYYTVSITKPVTFNFIDPDRGQIYDIDGNPMSITVDMSFSASFNYWDWNGKGQQHNNECPPIQPGEYNGDSPPTSTNHYDCSDYLFNFCGMRDLENGTFDTRFNGFYRWQGYPGEYLTDPEGRIIYKKTSSNQAGEWPRYSSDPACVEHPGEWEAIKSPYTTAGGMGGWGNSGMDFVLGGDAGEANSKVVALNITKKVVDEKGNLISLATPMTNTFYIYYDQDGQMSNVASYDNNTLVWNEATQAWQAKHTSQTIDYSGYTMIHSKKINVGAGGMGLIYDYSVSPGMFYIEESHAEEDLPTIIEDTMGKSWRYVDTYIETEYVWRGAEYNDKTVRHVTKDYTRSDDHYQSIPDILGSYQINDENCRNGFLEFFVYNVYEPEPVDIEVEKKWIQNGHAYTPPEGAQVTIKLGRYKLQRDSSYTPQGTLVINDSFTGLEAEDVSKYGDTEYIITGPGYNQTVKYNSFTNGSLTISNLWDGDYVVKKRTAAIDRYKGKPVMETAFVTVVNGNTGTASLKQTSYEKLQGEVQTVRVGVVISTYFSNVDSSPYNTGIVMDVPVNSSLVFNYHEFKYSDWSGMQRPKWYVYEWSQSEDWDVYHWIQRTPEAQNASPANDAVISVGTKPMAIMIDFTDVSAKKDMGITLVEQGTVGILNAAPRRRLLGNRSGSEPETTTVAFAASANPPASPVEGMYYVNDTSWTGNETIITLPDATTGWKKRLENLDKSDSDTGYDYVYYIASVNETGVDVNTQIVVNQDFTETVEDDTVLLSFGITNYKDIGSLTVQKQVYGISNPSLSFWFDINLTPPADCVLENSYAAVKTLADGVTEEYTHVDVSGSKVTVKLKDGEKIEILGLPVGTSYEVTERDPSQAGYTPGDHQNASGTIVAEGKTATMINEFYTEKAITLDALKVYENGTIAQNQFAFTISCNDPYAPLPTNTTVYADTSGNIHFGPITYTLASLRTSGGGHVDGNAKTFIYKVEEVLPGNATITQDELTAGYKYINGIRYDLTEKTVTVNVSYNETTGAMSATMNPTSLVSTPFNNKGVGSLALEKIVKIGDAALTVDNSALVRGRTYHFTIVGPSGQNATTKYVLAEARGGDGEVAEVFKYYVSDHDYGNNANDWYDAGENAREEKYGSNVLIEDLEPGQYTITEDVITDMTTTVSDGTTTTSSNIITVTVTAGTTASASVTFTNSLITTTSISAHKIWKDGTDQDDTDDVLPIDNDSADLEFELQSRVGTGSWTKVTKYEDGTDITNNPYTIHASDNWTATWNNLPKYQGTTEIEYRVLENKLWYRGTNYYVIWNQDGHYTVRTDRIDGEICNLWDITQSVDPQTGLITYINTLKGALKLKKVVTVNSGDPGDKHELVDGAYDFSISGPVVTGQDPSVVMYVRILVENGKMIKYTTRTDDINEVSWHYQSDFVSGEWAVVNLLPGDYIVQELGGYEYRSEQQENVGDIYVIDTDNPIGGVHLVSINNTPGLQKVTLTVVVGDTAANTTNAAATFKNNADTGSLKLTKLVVDENDKVITSDIADGTYSFEIMGPAPSETIAAKVTIKVENGNAIAYNLNDEKDAGDDLIFTSLTDVYAVISDLKTGDYTISETSYSMHLNHKYEPVPFSAVVDDVETQITDGNSVTVTVTSDNTADQSYVPATVDFTNKITLIPANLTVEKIWLDEDGNPVTGNVAWEDVEKVYITVTRKKNINTSDTDKPEDLLTFNGAQYLEITSQGKRYTLTQVGDDPDGTSYTATGAAVEDIETPWKIELKNLNLCGSDQYPDGFIVREIRVVRTDSSSGSPVEVPVVGYQTTYSSPSADQNASVISWNDGTATISNKPVETAKLRLKKTLRVDSSSPVNGDWTKTNGYYTFTVQSTSDASVRKYVIIRTDTDSSGNTTCTYKTGDMESGWTEADIPLWAGAGDVQQTTNDFAEIDLTPGQYIVKEVRTELDIATSDPSFLNEANIFLYDIDIPSHEGNSVDFDHRSATVWVGQGEATSVDMVFTNKMVPIIPNVTKMVIDINDSTDQQAQQTRLENIKHDSADFDIGDDVPYRISTTLPREYYRSLDTTKYYYALHDEMTHLQLKSGWAMYAFVKTDEAVNGETGVWYDVTSYFTIENGGYSNGKQTITVHPNNMDWDLLQVNSGYMVSNWGEDSTHVYHYPYLEPDRANTSTSFNSRDIRYLQFRYKATLMSDAVTGSEGNPNETWMTYENGTVDHGSTGKDKNKVFTYRLAFNKQDDQNNRLSGAEFGLYKKYLTANQANSQNIEAAFGANTSGWVDRTYKDNLGNTVILRGPASELPADMSLSTTDDTPVYVRVRRTANSDYDFSWNGIDDGQYLLIETVTPKGYKSLIAPVAITINAGHQEIADDPQMTSFTFTPSGEAATGSWFTVNKTETAVSGGTRVTLAANSVTGAIPNSPYPGIQIIKIDEPTRNEVNPTKLPGAEFTIGKWDSTAQQPGYTPYIPAGKTTATATTNAQGIAVFNPVEPGEYRIQETRTPTGYAIPDNVIYISVEYDADTGLHTVTRYDKAYGENRTEIENTSNVAGVTFVQATAAGTDPDTSDPVPGHDTIFTVGNTPTQLKLKKELSGNVPTDSNTKLFTFQLELSGDGLAKDQIYQLESTDTSRGVGQDARGTEIVLPDAVNGKYIVPIALLANETVTIRYLPNNVHYKVTEVDPPSGYAETATSQAGDKEGNIGLTVSSVTITNGYDTSATAVIEGIKEFTDGTIAANQFTFTLTAANGVPMPESGGETATAAAGTGAFAFGTITYPLALMNDVTAAANGSKTLTYTYNVTETVPLNAVNGILNLVQYDTTPKQVTVTVTYDTNSGAMAATVDPAAANFTFTNVQLGSVTVSKHFEFPEDSSLSVPDNFNIKAEWTIGNDSYTEYLRMSDSKARTVTGTNYTISAVSANDPYTWTISNLPIGTSVKFTEDGFTIPGYNVESTKTVNGAALTNDTTPTTGTTAAAVTPGSVAFTNSYTPGVELPSTGGMGTGIYTILGLMLMLTAGGFLAARKRRAMKGSGRN